MGPRSKELKLYTNEVKVLANKKSRSWNVDTTKILWKVVAIQLAVLYKCVVHNYITAQ